MTSGSEVFVQATCDSTRMIKIIGNLLFIFFLYDSGLQRNVAIIDLSRTNLDDFAEALTSEFTLLMRI